MRNPLTRFGLLVLVSVFVSCESTRNPASPAVATFSIVALDPVTGELGIAVASRVPAVGAIVPWAKAGVGAIATQSAANVDFGPNGLHLIASGKGALATGVELIATDPGAGQRQLGIVDAKGGVTTYTGVECLPWAGGRVGEGYVLQGNILTGPEVLDAMEAAFKTAKGPLPDRLLAALLAGDEAGGDRRGKQSAALLVVRDGWGYGGGNDRFRDLRVDDHAEPVHELIRLLKVHRKTFPRPRG